MLASLLLAMVFLYSDQESPFAAYRWEHRILVIDEKMEGAEEQLARFLEQPAALKDRDLLVFWKEENELICKNAEKASQVDRKNQYSGITLIGKDGGGKLHRQNAVDVEVVFDLIDSMPMRQSEMRRRKSR